MHLLVLEGEWHMVEPTASQADTRVYSAVHTTFRLMTNRFVDATQKQELSALQPMIGSHWDVYAALLHHHHHTEDESIFPALLAVRPDLQTLLDSLAEDHRQLVVSIDEASAAVSAFAQDPDPAKQKSMHQAIVVVRDAFFPHLDVEDAQIIPAITQSMPPKEWERLDQQALKSIPRQYLATAVGGLDEVIRGTPAEERPPPPPAPIRIMLALSWRKKWAAWVKPLLA
jgi:hemerythrin-like domain-containing protein